MRLFKAFRDGFSGGDVASRLDARLLHCVLLMAQNAVQPCRDAVLAAVDTLLAYERGKHAG